MPASEALRRCEGVRGTVHKARAGATGAGAPRLAPGVGLWRFEFGECRK